MSLLAAGAIGRGPRIHRAGLVLGVGFCLLVGGASYATAQQATGGAARSAAQQAVTLPAADRPIAARVSPVFSIGTAEGAAWEMFTRVISVAFDAQDNLYVLDQMDPRVVVFDARGKHLRTVGRKGPGPGELQMPTALAVLGDGTLVVNDLDRRAYSLWDNTGRFVRSVPYGDLTAGPTLNGLAAGGQQLLVKPTAGRAADQADGLLPIVRFDLATGKGTVALRLDPPVEDEDTKIEARGNTTVMRRTAVPTFSPTPLMGGFGDGTIAASYSFDYEVKLAGRSGERTIRRAVSTRRVTPADRDRILKDRREALERDGQITHTFRGGASSTSSKKLSASEIQQRLNAIEFSTTMPAIQGLLVDGRDVLWIARTPASGRSAGPIDLVRADGTYIGTLPNTDLPAAVSRSGLAAYMQSHPDGYQQVVVNRITW